MSLGTASGSPNLIWETDIISARKMEIVSVSLVTSDQLLLLFIVITFQMGQNWQGKVIESS